MERIIAILCVSVSLLYLKWLLIGIIFPFQCVYGQIHNKGGGRNSLFIYKIMGAPYYLWEKLFRGGWERYMIFHVGYIPSCHLRKFIYKTLGAQVGKRVVFHYKTEIRHPYNLVIGTGSIIGDNAILDARNTLQLGENVNLSSNVSIYTEQHDHRDPYFRCTKGKNKSVIIGDRAWIGSCVTILPGVNIGEGAVCCAGCVVTKDVEAFSVVAGIPAKKVNFRPRDLKYAFDGSSCRLF